MLRIPLTRGLFALVDESDYELLCIHRWAASGSFRSGIYAVRHERSSAIIMHREIMGASAVDVVDHRNGDKLDNRRSNLRVCTQAENVRNRRRVVAASGFKGVYRSTSGKSWEAGIKVNRKHLHLGTFPTPEEAAGAYDLAALAHFGEFAATNRCLGLLPIPAAARTCLPS
jgi:hypothetical protein